MGRHARHRPAAAASGATVGRREWQTAGWRSEVARSRRSSSWGGQGTGSQQPAGRHRHQPCSLAAHPTTGAHHGVHVVLVAPHLRHHAALQAGRAVVVRIQQVGGQGGPWGACRGSLGRLAHPLSTPQPLHQPHNRPLTVSMSYTRTPGSLVPATISRLSALHCSAQMPRRCWRPPGGVRRGVERGANVWVPRHPAPAAQHLSKRNRQQSSPLKLGRSWAPPTQPPALQQQSNGHGDSTQACSSTHR